jgi:ABC-type polysaccharide/polyol phosphate export permease
MTQTDPALERARKHVTEVRDFYYHLMVYAFVMVLLIFLDRRSGANDTFLGLDWAFWVILFWGLGVVGHAISVFFGDYRAQKMYESGKGR